MTYREPLYRPFYVAEVDAEMPGLYGIGCSQCGASNGWVQLAYSADKLIGASVELDRRLAERPMRHEPTGLPRFGPTARVQKGAIQPRRLRPSPDPLMRIAEANGPLTTDAAAPSRLWLHCLACNAGHLVDPIAQLVSSP